MMMIYTNKDTQNRGKVDPDTITMVASLADTLDRLRIKALASVLSDRSDMINSMVEAGLMPELGAKLG